jgi:hypothetical protein
MGQTMVEKIVSRQVGHTVHVGERKSNVCR